jgi:hypothetical protein
MIASIFARAMPSAVSWVAPRVMAPWFLLMRPYARTYRSRLYRCRYTCSSGSPLAPRWRMIPRTVAALRISRTSRSLVDPRLLCPFATRDGFPVRCVRRHAHDSYGHSVAIGFSPRRPSRVFNSMNVRASRRCPTHPRTSLKSALSAEGKVQASRSNKPGARQHRVVDAVAMGPQFNHWGLGFTQSGIHRRTRARAATS